MKTKTDTDQRWFVMTENGLGQFTVVSFGPFVDLANAKLTVYRLATHGIKSQVYSEQYAKECDSLGYYDLCKRFPKWMHHERKTAERHN